MKKKPIVVCLLIIFCFSFLMGFLTQHASATNDPFEVVSIDRTIHITYHKLFRVTDEYMFINTGNDPLSSIIIEFPYRFDSNIATFDVFGSDSNKLAIARLPYDGSGFLKWRVYLDSPIFGGDTVWILNNITCIDLGVDLSSEIAHVSFTFVKFPSSPYNIQNCSVTITCDPEITVYDLNTLQYYSTLKLVSGVSVPKNNETIYVSKYNLTQSSISWQYTISAIKFPYIRRQIEVDLWGYLYVTDKHMIENFGPYGQFKVTTFVFNIPPNAENFEAYDKFGALDYLRSEDDPKIISINFDSTRYTLERGENTSYWVSYRIPLLDHGQRHGDKIILDFDIFFGYVPCLVEAFDITLILPKDASINYILPSADSINTIDSSLFIIFNETDITPYNSKVIELEFDYTSSYFHFLARPLLFIIILVIACTSYVISKRVLPSEERMLARKTVVPTPILLEFCSLFEEKVSLVSEIEKLDEDLKSRKIKKRIYRNQRKTAERKILELNKDIEELKVNLKNAGGRFAQIANELEINEAERESAKDGLYNLEQRYLRKKISVVAYQKLSQDLFDRHRKSKTKIDKLIFELREILS